MDPPPSNSDNGDNRDHIRVLLCSYYTTIKGVGGPPKLWGCSVESLGSISYTVWERAGVVHTKPYTLNPLHGRTQDPGGGRSQERWSMSGHAPNIV